MNPGDEVVVTDPTYAGNVRFVFSAEPVERLATLPERLAGGRLEHAVAG